MQDESAVTIKGFKSSWFADSIEGDAESPDVVQGREMVKEAVKTKMHERMLSVLNKDFHSPLTLAA